ncbi:MAG: YraN family protein [Betaproteobacteria bacterium]|nr:YraN family protein [Betaproteobacteria bacterium]
MAWKSRALGIWQEKWKTVWNRLWAKHTTRIGNHDGMKAEALAADFLRARGLRIIARNFRIRGGEIDLIAEEKTRDVIVFVEVRLRRSQRFGGASASIIARKRRRIILAARHWLARHGSKRQACRFDCVLLDRLESAGIEWVKHAFRADI